MGRDDDSWKRIREREDEADRVEQASDAKLSEKEIKNSISEASSEKLDDLIARAEVLIEQLNNLYNMFAVGVERLPPIERRSQLDQTMLSLQFIGKPTQAALFKYNGILSRFVSYRDRWDKLVKDVENGKVKRVTGPQRVQHFKK